MHPLAILAIGVTVVLAGILAFRLHAFLALLLAGLVVGLLTPSAELSTYAASEVAKNQWTQKQADSFVASTAAERLAKGFGATAQSIGILIALAAIVGKGLLDSGAADKIVRSIVRWVGPKHAAIALVASGFILAIPVFFDTVFYLLMPLGKALWLRTRKHYLLYVLAIVAGGTMAHSLVPPTPGPLFVAGELGVDLLTMILAGTAVGACASVAGYAFARWSDQRMEIPLRDSADAAIADLQTLADRPDHHLPPLWASLLPIVLPVLLIALDSFLSAQGTILKSAPAWLSWLVETLGDKNVALGLGAIAALALLARKPTASQPIDLRKATSAALAAAGPIILITSAGGAFGAAIQQCGVAAKIATLAGTLGPFWVLPMAFAVTALIRTAQGSSTVAMITAVGVLKSVADPAILGCDPVYLALAIGCGSKPISWMADSGFWVICQMSGLTEREGLRTVSPLTLVMGLAGLAATLAAATLWPGA